ncbi:MAG: MopE-related protein [Candidatus Altiarchaeota archaeon]
MIVFNIDILHLNGKGGVGMVKKHYFRNLLFEFLVFFVVAFIIAQNVIAVTWPNESDWVLIYTDPTPDSSCEHRDVNATYYYFSGQYMYLRMDTIAPPTFGGSGSCKDSLYKWFLDFNGDAYVSGSSNIIHNYEYLIIAYDNKSYLCDSNDFKIGQCAQITNKNIEDFNITGKSLYMVINLSYIDTSTVKSVYWTVESSTQNLNQRPSGNSVDWSDFGSGNITQPFIPIPHVTIAKTADKITVVNGENVKFTLNIYNDGQAVLHNVTVLDLLPIGLTYISGSASPAPNSTNGQILTWSLGNIVNGTSQVITFNAAVGIQNGTLVNYANVTGIGIENKSLVSDEDTATLTVIEPALYLDKIAIPSPAVQGNPISYTIQISNNASTGAYNVTVIDSLPNEVIYNSASCADATISYNSLTHTVTIFFNLIVANTGYSCAIDCVVKNDTGNTTITNHVNLTYVNSNGILQTPLYDSVSTYIQYCINGSVRPCGDLNCIGTQTCYNGFWGNCTSMGEDCGVCCICSDDPNNPKSNYDETQDDDCYGYNLPIIARCDYDPDNNPYTWDYAPGFTSECVGKFACKQGAYTYTHTCNKSECNAECDAVNPCLDKCDGTNYYKSDGCQANCNCSFSITDCSQSNGWYDTGNTRNYTLGPCGDIEQKEQEYRMYTCNSTNPGCIYTVSDTRWINISGINYYPSFSVCRPSQGVCDLEETCTGESVECPTDFKSTAECRASAGDCDIAEYCDGQSNDCPADQFRSNTYVCRPSNGPCDVEEYCTGSSAFCPEDESGPNLFFSEYVEGSSNNKALEIYNPKNTAINLSGYKIEIYHNGQDNPLNTIILPSVTLASGDVYVICDNDASTSILANCDLQSTITFFNGDDTIVLKNPAGAILDVIGQVGFDPGMEWGSGNTSTADNTLVRKCDITCGDMNPNDAFEPAIEWYGYAQDTFIYLGNHSTICCGNGQFDSGEQCESPFDVCCDNVTCQFKSSGVVCRPKVDACDVEDYCTGDSASCTSTDAKAPAGTLCGLERLCPSSYCDGFIAKFYPKNGHDTCDGQGNCVNYSCEMLNSYCTDNDRFDGVNTLECGAECDQDSDCPETNCDNYDKCYDGTYRDYENVPNTCMNTCYCTKTGCSNYIEVITDNDKDGYDIECDNDCNDSDWSINPGAKEICNGLDDDCDGVVDNITEACGIGNCTGTRICINGIWTDCSSKGRDIGICAICDSQGNPTYDETQDDDCPAVLCPESGCGAGNCGEHIWGSYPKQVENYCQSIYTCTQNICNVACESDNDKDNWSMTCGDCNDDNPNINPGMEEQCNSLDDNCNNITDENLTSSRQCGVSDVGICKLGYEFRYCIDGNYTDYQDCTAIFPKSEICDNGLDDDCDGKVDEGCGTGGGGGGINLPKIICNDGIQNYGEEGIDCGGPCPPCPVTPVEETTTTITPEITTTTTTTTETPTTTQTTTTFPIATTTTIVAPSIIGAAINVISGTGGAILLFLALLAFLLFLWWKSRKYVATPSFLSSLESEELKRLVESKKTLYVTESVLSRDTRLKEFVEEGKVKVAELKKDKKLDELLEILKVKLDQETAEALALAIQMKAKLFAKNKAEVNLALKRGLKVYTKI